MVKTLNPTILCLFLTFYKYVNVTSKSNKRKKIKNLFFVGILKVYDDNSRIRIQDLDPFPLVRHSFADPDPDPHQNVMAPQHWSMRIRIHNTDFSGGAVWVELVAVFVFHLWMGFLWLSCYSTCNSRVSFPFWLRMMRIIPRDQFKNLFGICWCVYLVDG